RPRTTLRNSGCTNGSPPDSLISQSPGRRGDAARERGGARGPAARVGEEARKVAGPAAAVVEEALRAVAAAVVAAGVHVPGDHAARRLGRGREQRALGDL